MCRSSISLLGLMETSVVPVRTAHDTCTLDRGKRLRGYTIKAPSKLLEQKVFFGCLYLAIFSPSAKRYECRLPLLRLQVRGKGTLSALPFLLATKQSLPVEERKKLRVLQIFQPPLFTERTRCVDGLRSYLNHRKRGGGGGSLFGFSRKRRNYTLPFRRRAA